MYIEYSNTPSHLRFLILNSPHGETNYKLYSLPTAFRISLPDHFQLFLIAEKLKKKTRYHFRVVRHTSYVDDETTKEITKPLIQFDTNKAISKRKYQER